MCYLVAFHTCYAKYVEKERSVLEYRFLLGQIFQLASVRPETIVKHRHISFIHGAWFFSTRDCSRLLIAIRSIYAIRLERKSIKRINRACLRIASEDFN